MEQGLIVKIKVWPESMALNWASYLVNNFIYIIDNIIIIKPSYFLLKRKKKFSEQNL